jgi:hypothetical protein
VVGPNAVRRLYSNRASDAARTILPRDFPAALVDASVADITPGWSSHGAGAKIGPPSRHPSATPLRSESPESSDNLSEL